MHAQAQIVTLEVIMIVGSRLGAASDASKVPTVELAGEGSEFRLFKVFRHELRREALLMVNHKATAIR